MVPGVSKAQLGTTRKDLPQHLSLLELLQEDKGAAGRVKAEGGRWLLARVGRCSSSSDLSLQSPPQLTEEMGESELTLALSPMIPAP